jgi:CHASE2 domain-containing sensor protein
MTTTITPARALWRPLMWGGVAALLALPAVAMRFNEGVDWTATDFVLAGVFLGGAALLVELVMRRGRNPAHRAGVCLAVLAGLLLVWVTGAVGIIGSEDHPANLLYGGVLAAAVVGSVLARFRPGGMAVAMATAAALQVAIGIAALVAGWGADEPNALRAIVGASGVFALMWTVSAVLLRQAVRPIGN